MSVRVVLPTGLQNLVGSIEVQELDVARPVTPLAIIRALDEKYPQLRGAVIDPLTGQRRPMLRFFGGRQDLSFEPLDQPVSEAIAAGAEEFLIVGAIAGG